MKTVALEDLAWWTFGAFLGSLRDLGYKGDGTLESVEKWFCSKTPAQGRRIAGKFLDSVKEEKGSPVAGLRDSLGI